MLSSSDLHEIIEDNLLNNSLWYRVIAVQKICENSRCMAADNICVNKVSSGLLQSWRDSGVVSLLQL